MNMIFLLKKKFSAYQSVDFFFFTLLLVIRLFLVKRIYLQQFVESGIVLVIVHCKINESN